VEEKKDFGFPTRWEPLPAQRHQLGTGNFIFIKTYFSYIEKLRIQEL